ncbi:hypothetical protein BDR03DRAFT_968516 [Suillus americanus]|nr:hypothetical protein BDR03DRAFT_968516 [Suillus americanus]
MGALLIVLAVVLYPKSRSAADCTGLPGSCPRYPPDYPISQVSDTYKSFNSIQHRRHADDSSSFNLIGRRPSHDSMGVPSDLQAVGASPD